MDDEARCYRRPQLWMDLTLTTIVQTDTIHQKVSVLIESARFRPELLPGEEETFEMICTSLFRGALLEKFGFDKC